jgi:hypothetical protein
MGRRKLWILEPIPNHPNWESWYDKAFGFVVVATSENEARKIAQGEGGDERGYLWGDKSREIPAWTDPTYSTCEPLVASELDIGVVIRDFCSA